MTSKTKLKPPPANVGINRLMQAPGANAGLFARSSDQKLMEEKVTTAQPEAGQPSPSPLILSEFLGFHVGQVVEVPLLTLSVHELNARVHYSMADIDGMAASLTENGQEVPARGYVDGNKVVLIDGQKRLKGAVAASLKTLRVEICEKPASPLDVYFESRRINVERSSQTVLDDALRFQQLLNQNLVKDQKTLAQRLQISETTLSQTLAINAIPDSIVKQMKERPTVCAIKAAYGISRLFTDGRKRGADEEKLAQIAVELIARIDSGELTSRQIAGLVDARLEGPKKRATPTADPISYGEGKGMIKMFPSKGEITLSVKDLKPEQFEELSTKLKEVFEKKGG